MEEKRNEELSVKEVEEKERTSIEKGLSEEEAKARQAKYGKNALAEKKKKNVIQIFFSQLNDPLIYVLFAAVALTIGVSIYDTVKALNEGLAFNFLETGDWPDVIIIFAVILLNALIGTIQEKKAQTSLEALKKMSSPESTVLRDGKRKRIKSEDLVPGDIVYLEEGDTVGADLRLVESVNLKIDESSLTGESVPVEKDASRVFDHEVGIGDKVNCAYMSTTVTYGRGIGIVSKTGMSTEIGKIANSLDSEPDDPTPLQKSLAKLSKSLGLITLFIVIAVFLVNLIWIFVDGKNTQVESYIEALLSSISLAVAAVPEGLAAIVTIVLSIGVQKMVKANTIVRKLPSVETLGAVSVICSDKTGTLTQNKMTVVKAYTDFKEIDAPEFSPKTKNPDLLTLAKGMSLCSNATVDEGLYGDPTEIALVAFANAFDMHKKDLEASSPRIEELPFDSVRKMMSTLHQDGEKKVLYTKGALDSILAHTDRILVDGQVREITKEDIERINQQNSRFSEEALRVLALAYGDEGKIEENHLIFVGLVAMIDPARPEAKQAVAKLKEAGIRTVMITGDHKDTAYAIAKDLGICSDKSQCYTGADVDKMSEQELQETVKTARVFARVSPENKVQIVKAFKANGNIVAMTGDGVNDAPSLKAADIGIAMGITGTDVAKSAADMVLTDDNFASIEKAVEEGRGIYANIRRTVLFLLSTNITEVLGMFLITLVGLPSPFLAIHLLWINLITDSLPAIALGMQPKNPSIMKEKPRDPNESLFAHGGASLIAWYGTFLTIGTIVAYLCPAWLNGTFSYSGIKALYEQGVYLEQAQTMTFTALAFMELIHMIGMSDLDRSFVHVFKDRNGMLWLALLAGIALQLLVIEVPGMRAVFSTINLDWQEWLITLAIGFFPLTMHEIAVLVKYVKSRQEKPVTISA